MPSSAKVSPAAHRALVHVTSSHARVQAVVSNTGFELFNPVDQDEERLKTYTLSPIPPSLQRELDGFKDYRARLHSP